MNSAQKFAAWLDALLNPPTCTHSYNCFVNAEGYTECPCGVVIYEEMGS